MKIKIYKNKAVEFITKHSNGMCVIQTLPIPRQDGTCPKPRQSVVFGELLTTPEWLHPRCYNPLPRLTQPEVVTLQPQPQN